MYTQFTIAVHNYITLCFNVLYIVDAKFDRLDYLPAIGQSDCKLTAAWMNPMRGQHVVARGREHAAH